MFAIDATGLTKSFRGTWTVDGVDLRIEEGDIVGLLGHPLPREHTKALEKTNFTASYVGMPDRMRVWEILNVFCRIYGAPRARVGEVMELFDLTSLAKRTITQLSSGQRTLLGLARRC
jgi:ABC-2 type transport system ATP-binding protein